MTRELFAERYGISIAQSKELFQGLFDLRTFNGSRSGISEIIGVQKCQKALGDDFLVGLRNEAIRAWSEVGLAKRADGQRRFAYYEQLEQTVMAAIYQAADEAGVRYWPFHDGVTLLDLGRRISNLSGMFQLVREQTGYDILLDERIL